MNNYIFRTFRGSRPEAKGFLQQFIADIDSPLIEYENTDNGVKFTIDGDTQMRYTADGSGFVDLYVNEVYGCRVVNWGNPFIAFAVFSDTFFHLYHFSYQWWGGGAKIDYLYEIIGDRIFEGYKCLDTADWDDCHIYDYYIYDKETGVAYKHAKMLNYVAEHEEEDDIIEFTPDVLFDSSGTVISRIVDPHFVTCTTVTPTDTVSPGVPKQKIVVIDGNEYLAVESNLLVPLFDQPEPEPEPGPDNEENQDSETQES